jgi:excisionase family DNA binding protein
MRAAPKTCAPLPRPRAAAALLLLEQRAQRIGSRRRAATPRAPATGRPLSRSRSSPTGVFHPLRGAAPVYAPRGRTVGLLPEHVGLVPDELSAKVGSEPGLIHTGPARLHRLIFSRWPTTNGSIILEQMQKMESELLHVKEAAQLLGQHPVSIRRHIRDGSLRAVRLGPDGRVRVPREALDAFVQP